MENPNEGAHPNILLLSTYAHGGAGVACRRLAAALQSTGIPAQVLTQSQVSGRFNFFAERVSFLPWERDKSVRFSFSLANFGTNITQHPGVAQADVIHLHWWNQGFLSLRNLSQLSQTKKKLVWTLHDMWAFTGGCHYDWGCGRFEQQCGQCPYLRFRYDDDLSHQVWSRKKKWYPHQLEIVTCSRWLAEKARKSSLLGHYPITAIPNPIDTEQYRPIEAPQKAAFRLKLGLPEQTPLILFAAMNIKNPFKGFLYFKEAMQALASIPTQEPPVVVVVGKSEPEDFEGIPYPVVRLGLIQDMAEMAHIYAACDVFVIPSLEENLPNTIMESLSCGTPVVGFNIGGIPEMITDGVHGKVTEAKNSRQMAADIAWVLAEPIRRQTLGQQAREKVLQHYAPDLVAAQYLKIYKR